MTGVQTCALPICRSDGEPRLAGGGGGPRAAAELSPPLPVEKPHGGGLLGFLVAGEGAPRGQMRKGVGSG